MRIRRNNLFAVVFAALLILHLLLICSIRIYPFVDVPYHLAAATILRFYGQPTNQFAKYYTIPTLFETHVVHTVFCALPIFPSVEFGNKIFYALYVLLLPLSVLLIIRKLGGNPWVSLLSFLLLYNWNVTWGFAQFTIAIPFVLLLFYFMLDSLEEGHVLSRIIAGLLCCLLFFMHIVPLMFSLFITYVCCLYRCRSSWKMALKGSIVTLPGLALLIAWLRTSQSKLSAGVFSLLGDYYRNDYLKQGLNGIVERLQHLLLSSNYALGPWWASKYRIPLLFSLVLMAPFIWWLTWHWTSLRRGENLKFAYAGLFFLCALACFFLLPSGIQRIDYLYERLEIFVWLSAIILNSLIAPKQIRRAITLGLCVVCAVHFLLWFAYFGRFQKEVSSFTKDLMPDNPKHTMGALIYDYEFEGRGVYNHFPSYYIVWKQGIATSNVADYQMVVIHKRTDGDAGLLPVYREMVGTAWQYDGRFSGMDYILVRGELPQADMSYMKGSDLLKRQAKWSLYVRQGLNE